MKTNLTLKQALSIFCVSLLFACQPANEEEHNLDPDFVMQAHKNMRQAIEPLFSDSTYYADTQTFASQVLPVLQVVEETEREIRSFQQISKRDSLIQGASLSLIAGYQTILRTNFHSIFTYIQTVDPDSVSINYQKEYKKWIAEDADLIAVFNVLHRQYSNNRDSLETFKIKVP